MNAPTPPPGPFLGRLRSLLLPLDGWGRFRPGARPAAVTAILYRRAGAWYVPFVARRSDLASHPGQIGLPGGGVREGEGAWEAAVREAQEEIGIASGSLVPLGAGPPVYTAVTNFSVVPFVAWLDGDEPGFRPDPGELEAVLEVPLARLLDESAWRTSARPSPGRHLPIEGAMIWGLTARLLADLLPTIARALDG
jgi:8-oxo-dGTP pyrophosphatase MutT (NUDIX family)